MVVSPGSDSGFTFIELMLAVLILAIIAAVAYPSYSAYVKRSNRVEMQTYMVQIAQNLENYKLAHNNYADATLTPYGGDKFPITGTPNYQLRLTNAAGIALNVSGAENQSWLLVARPLPEGAQKNTGALSLSSNHMQCWYKNKDEAKITTSINKDGESVATDSCTNQWTDS